MVNISTIGITYFLLLCGYACAENSTRLLNVHFARCSRVKLAEIRTAIAIPGFQPGLRLRTLPAAVTGILSRNWSNESNQNAIIRSTTKTQAELTACRLHCVGWHDVCVATAGNKLESRAEWNEMEWHDTIDTPHGVIKSETRDI